MRKFRLPVLCLLILILAVVGSVLMAESAQLTTANTLEGWFSVIYGDGQPGSSRQSEIVYRLILDDRETVGLDLSRDVLAAAGGSLRLQNQRVRVITAVSPGSRAQVAATQISLQSSPQAVTRQVVTGSQPWVTIMCAFPGNPDGQGTRPLNYFQNMYSSSYPGLDHYWREASFNQINLLGSQAHGWYTLPHPQTYYVPVPGSNANANLDGLRADCMNAADADVNFTSFVGINMMFNGNLDCCAWGGGAYITADGTTRLWRVTWEPPWAWSNQVVIAHETGHGFGLPHSNSHGTDGNTYPSSWDVMSEGYNYCSLATDPVYGCLAQHTNAGYKDYLGWIPANRKLVFTEGSTGAITLDHAALQSTNHYQMILIPLGDTETEYYVVEARQTTSSGYDQKLPGKAVLIWKMNLSVTDYGWQYGTDEEGKWVTGETFSDGTFSVSVLGETADGFVVSVSRDAAQIISSGSMENDADNNRLPDGWKGKNLTKDRIKCNTETKFVAHTGRCALMFKGSAGEGSSLSQNGYLAPFADNDTLSVSAYVNASSASINAKIKLVVSYTNTALGKEKVSLPFTVTNGYEEIPNGVTLKSGDVSKIKFNIQNRSTAGKFYIDDVALIWDQAAAFQANSVLALPVGK